MAMPNSNLKLSKLSTLALKMGLSGTKIQTEIIKEYDNLKKLGFEEITL